MRTYRITNADGISYDLTSVGVSFLHDVSGLGFKRDTKYTQIDTRFSSIKDVLAQQDITGTVRFFQPGAVKQYYDFVRFISNAPLTLHYNPGIGEFLRRGKIVTLEKTDSAGGALKAVITFRCTTPWFHEISVYNDGSGGDGKKYDYRYDYIYTDFAAQTVQIESDSFVNCPAKLMIYGPAVNPSWRHYVNSELVATGQIMATIEDGRVLVVDTTTLPYRIEQRDLLGNLVSDLYQRSVFSTKRFIMLQHGVNTITAAHESAATLRLALEAELEYSSV